MEMGQPSLPRLASQLNYLSKFIFIYMRGGPALLGGISLLTTEISPRRAGNFPYKCNIFGPPIRRLASQSSVHTTKFVLASIFLDNFSFYRFCLFMRRL